MRGEKSVRKIPGSLSRCLTPPGFLFRTGAHLVLSLVPVVGDSVSAVIAASGTKAIGKAAAAFYIDGVPTAKVRRLFRKEKKSAAKDAKALHDGDDSDGDDSDGD